MNITQEDLGNKVGYAEPTRRQAISQIERGAIAIPNKRLNQFIDTLNLDTSFYQQLSFLLSTSKYEEVINMLEEREAREMQLAVNREYVGGEGYSHSQTANNANVFNVTHSHAVDEQTYTDINAEKNTILEVEQKLLILKDLLEKNLINSADYDMKKKDILDKYF
jgi:transcriptional regulator with XRE-family HTH domain